TTVAENKSAASVPVPSAGVHSRAWDSAAQPVRTTCPTAPPAPFLPKTSLAASSSCTARIPSSSPVSSACSQISSGLTLSILAVEREHLISVSLGTEYSNYLDCLQACIVGALRGTYSRQP